MMSEVALTKTEKLVEAVRGVMQASAKKPEIVAALAAAESLSPGLVIATEDQAVEVAGLVRSIIDGEKALKADMDSILRVPKAMERAVRDTAAPAQVRLSAAKTIGNEARVAWQALVRRRAEEEQRRLEEQARIAHAQAEDEGMPLPEVARVPVPRTVVSGTAKSGTQVRVEAVQIVDDAACPLNWKILHRATAEGFFRSAELNGEVKRAPPGESVIYMGVRFESVERAANR